MRTSRKAGWAYAIAGAVLVTCGCGGRAVVPSSYNTHKAADKSFQIDYPAEWKAEGGGTKLAWASFTSGNAKIDVETGLTGSLIGDIAQSQNTILGVDPTKQTEGGPDLAPARAAHDFEKPAFIDQTGFTEQDPVPVKTGFGDSRKSEFTGSGSFGGSIRGYRATALGRDKRVRIVCQCPEAEWETLKPVFDKVIESVGFARPDKSS